MEWLIPYKVDDDTPASDAPVPPASKAVSPNPQAKLPRVAVAGACALTLERWLPTQLARALSTACGSSGETSRTP